MGTYRRGVITTIAAGAAVALVALAPLSVSAPASATVSGTTSSGDAVLYPSCQTHDVAYAIDVSSDTSFWNLEIQVENAAGDQSEGTVLSSTKNSPKTGTVQISLCGAEPPGTWTVHGTGIYETSGLLGARTSYALPDSTFTVSRAATRTALGQKALRHHRVRLTSTVSDQRVGGFARTEGAPVDLQRLVDGTWQKVRRSHERTIHGHTTTVVRATRGARYRAVTSGIGNYTGSISAPLTIH